MNNNLTNLANAKDWCSSKSTAGDKIISRLITSISQTVLDWMNRQTFVSKTYSETYNGNGSPRMYLRNWPVTSIQLLSIDNIAIPVIPPDTGSGQLSTIPFPGFGYRYEAWDGIPPGDPIELELSPGTYFSLGGAGVNPRNVRVDYTAGYLVANEAQTVPSTNNNQVTVNQQYGTWIADNGVTYANGTPLTLTSGVPSIGQYALVSGSGVTSEAGVYQFAAADQGAGVLISYSFVPSTVEQVVLNMINEELSLRGRPGIKTRNLAGQESMSYDLSGIPEWAATRLQSYRMILPV